MAHQTPLLADCFGVLLAIHVCVVSDACVTSLLQKQKIVTKNLFVWFLGSGIILV